MFNICLLETLLHIQALLLGGITETLPLGVVSWPILAAVVENVRCLLTDLFCIPFSAPINNKANLDSNQNTNYVHVFMLFPASARDSIR